MRTFVTGGAGFVGSHTVATLLDAGHDVVIWDDLSTGKRENLAAVIDQVTFLDGDVRDFESLRAAVHQSRPDAILHLAAIPSVPLSVEQPRLTHTVNVMGTINVLEAARREEIERVVFACSAAIYGNTGPVPKNESMLPGPSSPYGLEKWQSEQYTELYSTLFGFTTVSLRYFNVFGPRQDPKNPYTGVISVYLDRLLNDQQLVIDGTGEQTRDFIYVADVAEANLRALTTPLIGHQRVNIGRGVETSIRQLHDLLCEIVGRPPDPVFGPPRPGDIVRSVTEVGRARAVLDFAARHTVADGLQRLVEWYRSRAGHTAGPP
jgi:UDP-glucose 4-epimerase